MNKLLILFIVTLIISCGERAAIPEEGMGSFSKDSFILAVKELSSDEYQGRKPFTPGEEKTVNYISKKFAALGLEPGNGNSWYQEVPMVNIRASADSTMKVQSPSGEFILKAFDSYIIWTDKTDATQSFQNNEVVFAGYGVVAPEYNWNDYAGLDVKGKVVIVLVNDPGFNAGDTSLFKGKTMTYYGRWTYKFEEAARQGAKGCLIVHETKAAGYPFSVQQASFNTARLQLDDQGKTSTHCDIIGWMTDTTAKRLMNISGINADSLIASADRKGFKPLPLPLKFSTSMKVQTDRSTTKNVIGKIKGSKYPDETIIYTAHWDHLGIGKPDETGDSIYNGAFDNATGIAGLFEIARAFKGLQTPPERSIIFLAVTAEEQGLWGSDYYARNPVYPIEKTVANINMDGVNYIGRTKDVVSIGKGLSEMEDILAEEAKRQGRHMADEDHPEAGYYYRSDHFNFAKRGVPSLHFDDGIEMEKFGREEVKKMKAEYREKHYHRPSDEYNESWDVSGAIEDFQLYFMTGRRLANSRTWPKWKEGAEFRAEREKTESLRK